MSICLHDLERSIISVIACPNCGSDDVDCWTTNNRHYHQCECGLSAEIEVESDYGDE